MFFYTYHLLMDTLDFAMAYKKKRGENPCHQSTRKFDQIFPFFKQCETLDHMNQGQCFEIIYHAYVIHCQCTSKDPRKKEFSFQRDYIKTLCTVKNNRFCLDLLDCRI